MGDIRLQIARGAMIILCDVLYIPNATVHLISVSALTRDSNAVTHFDNSSCWITNKSTGARIAQGPLHSNKRLYFLTLHAAFAEHTFAVHSVPNIITWHNCLGHANYQALQDMARKGTITGTPAQSSFKHPKCESCILGKQTQTPVPKKCTEGEGHRVKWKLEKVWVDLSGPHNVKSHSGNSYVMNIVDDYTSHPWSIPLKNKGDAYPELKAWELQWERETGSQVGTYITDSGELKSDEMEAWLKTCGTDHRFMAPYTSAHIGRVERMHQTLMGKACTMQIHANLPPYLWDELYLTASHLHAKTTTRSLQGSTPWEMWHERSPDYSYMREIGCKAFVFIQNQNNPKIYERSIECVLIGYEPRSKAYQCYHCRTNKVYSSYHVHFIESHGNPTLTTSTPSYPQHTPESTNGEPPDTFTQVDFDDDDMLEVVRPTVQPVETLPIIPAPEALQEAIGPCRSSRILIPTAKHANGGPPNTQLDNVIHESKDSVEHIKAQCIERKKILEGLRNIVASNQSSTDHD